LQTGAGWPFLSRRHHDDTLAHHPGTGPLQCELSVSAEGVNEPLPGDDPDQPGGDPSRY
jgi:hypothetical protein